MVAAIAAVGVMMLVAMRRRAAPDHIPWENTIGGCSVRRVADGFVVDPLVRPLPPRLEMNIQGQDRWRSGDPSFDDAILICGDERWLAARMNAEMRHQILQLNLACSAHISGGRLRARPRKIFGGSHQLENAMQLAVRVAGLLAETIDVPRGIAENTRDPIAGVRKQCLGILIRDHLPGSKLIASELLTDLDPDVRFIAARHVGARGSDVLWDLAKDRGVAERLRALALAEYVHFSMVAEAHARLGTLLLEPQTSLVKAAIARAVQTIGGPFEKQMLAMLEEDDRTQLEAIKALARIGTLESVEPLLQLAKRSRADDEVRAMARQTVATIQNAARGEGGRLSVVEGEGAGKLSVAEGGELSVKEDT